MQERVILSFLIISMSIHETEPIKGSLNRLGVPEFLKQRFAFLPEFPLRS